MEIQEVQWTGRRCLKESHTSLGQSHRQLTISSWRVFKKFKPQTCHCKDLHFIAPPHSTPQHIKLAFSTSWYVLKHYSWSCMENLNSKQSWGKRGHIQKSTSSSVRKYYHDNLYRVYKAQNWILSFKEKCYINQTNKYVPCPHSLICQYFPYKLFFDLLIKHVRHNLKFDICLHSIQTWLGIYHSLAGWGVKGQSMPRLGSLTQYSQKRIWNF